MPIMKTHGNYRALAKIAQQKRELKKYITLVDSGQLQLSQNQEKNSINLTEYRKLRLSQDQNNRKDADENYRTKNYPQALDFYKKIINKNIAVYQNMARAYHEMKDEKNAQEYGQKTHDLIQKEAQELYQLYIIPTIAKAAIFSVPISLPYFIMGLISVGEDQLSSAGSFALGGLSFVATTGLYAANDILTFKMYNSKNSEALREIKVSKEVVKILADGVGLASLFTGLATPPIVPPYIEGITAEAGKSLLLLPQEEFAISTGSSVGLTGLGIGMALVTYSLQKGQDDIITKLIALRKIDGELISEGLYTSPKQELMKKAIDQKKLEEFYSKITSNKLSNVEQKWNESLKITDSLLNPEEELPYEKATPIINAPIFAAASALGIAVIGGTFVAAAATLLGVTVATAGSALAVLLTAAVAFVAVGVIGGGLYAGYQVYSNNKRAVRKDIESYKNHKQGVIDTKNDFQNIVENESAQSAFKTRFEALKKIFADKLSEIHNEYIENKSSDIQSREKVYQLRNDFINDAQILVKEEAFQKEIKRELSKLPQSCFTKDNLLPLASSAINAMATPITQLLPQIFNTSVMQGALSFLGIGMFTAVSVTVSNFLTKLGGVVFRANKSRELEEKLDQYVTAKADGIVKETLMTLSGKDKKSFLGEIKPLNSLKDSNLSSSDSSSSLASVGTFPASDKQNKQASSKEPSDLIPKLSIGYIGY